MLVRWEILLVRWAKYLSVGAENYFRDLQKKKSRPFFRRPNRVLN